MKLTLNQLLIVAVLFLNLTTFAQQKIPNETQKAVWNGKMEYHYVSSIKEQVRSGSFIPATIDKNNNVGKDKRTPGNKVIPGKGLPERFDPLVSIQKNATTKSIKATSLTFETTNSTFTPSDPTGAIGRDYYIASWNTAFRIFNKDGTPATDAADLSTLFPGGADGDPIVLYDAQADRYIVTEFEDSPNGFHVAISETNDPINDGWHVYSADNFQTGTFPDYTKFSIWSDGYYVTANISGGNGNVWALERDKMLTGDTSASIQAFTLPGIETNGFYSPQVFNITDDDFPSTGNATVVYMQDDAWANVTYDHLKLWTINVDWTDSSNSTISAATEIATTAFTGVFDGGSFSNLSQPSGPDIDAMQATIMNQAQFRKFDTYNSVVFNFVVNTDTVDELAGIRWYELRQDGDGQPWSIYQEGTYVAPEGRHAFGASMAMDGEGNIGMGYSSLSDTESISLRYSGRFKDDPLNTMTALEELIVISTSDNPSNRYADYSHLTVDPSNDADFWFVSEYFNNGTRSDIAAVFQLSEPLDNDLSLSAINTPSDGVLTDSETVSVTIRNLGINDQSNFPVSYSIDGGSLVTESYNGTITAGESVSYTFATTADLSTFGQTYSITASTSLTTDENTDNDSTTKEVTHSICMPEAIIGCGVDGIKKFVLGTINVDDGSDGCNSTGIVQGYVDRTDLSTDLSRGISHTASVQHNYASSPASERLSLWIDFDDSKTFETDEQLIMGVAFSVADTLEDFIFAIPETATLGTHLLRVKAIDADASGDINEACTDFSYGEVHDYTVNIVEPATNDLAIVSIDAPVNGSLSNAETITISITNLGTTTVSNFPVSYSVDGGTPITETYTDPIAQNETVSYSFSTTADLSINNQTYTIEASVLLSGDENNSNDSSSVQVTNSVVYCIPEATVSCSIDGIKRFVLGTIDVDDGSDGCNSTGDINGYVDRRELSTDLDRSSSEAFVLQAQHNWTFNPSGESLSMWIDFDDSGSFESSEQLITGESFTVAGELDSFMFDLPDTAPLGNHILRAKAIDITSTGDINDPCSDFSYGEVHDYTVTIIDGTLSTDDIVLGSSEITVLTLPNKQYRFELTTPYEDILSFRVYTMLGKQIVFNNISKEGNKYTYDLDMSYAPTGLYVIKMGNSTNFKSVKLLVK